MVRGVTQGPTTRRPVKPALNLDLAEKLGRARAVSNARFRPIAVMLAIADAMDHG